MAGFADDAKKMAATYPLCLVFWKVTIFMSGTGKKYRQTNRNHYLVNQ